MLRQQQAQDYIRSLPIKPRVPFATLYPHANPLALELLAQLLYFDPAKRISCDQALAHPYLAVWHDPNDEPICPNKFDFSFEDEESMDGMKKLIIQEVNEFRAEVRRGRRDGGNARRKDRCGLAVVSTYLPGADIEPNYLLASIPMRVRPWMASTAYTAFPCLHATKSCPHRSRRMHRPTASPPATAKVASALRRRSSMTQLMSWSASWSAVTLSKWRDTHLP